MIRLAAVHNLHDAKLFALQRAFVVNGLDYHVIMLAMAESERAEFRAYFEGRGGRVVGERGE